MNLKNVISSLLFRRFTPRFAYTHIFIEDESRHSMLHVQNPFSFFWPEGLPSATVRISLNSSSGKALGQVRRKIEPFGTLAISISDILKSLEKFAGLGTITIDIVPPPEFRKYLHTLTDGVARISSPFWMRFFDEIGSQAYVHSIEADRTQIYGVPRFLSRAFVQRDSSVQWSSDRTIRLTEGEKVIAFIVNHSRRVHSCKASWISPETGIVVTQDFTIASKGVVEFSTSYPGDVYLMVDTISTSNAKPYVMVQSQSQQFAITHG